MNSIPFDAAASTSVNGDHGVWGSLLDEMKQHLAAYGLGMGNSKIQLSPMLHLDVATESFVGDHADEGNKLLKREYRAPFVVPEITI